MNVRTNRVFVIMSSVCMALLLVGLVFIFRFNSAYRKETRSLKEQYHRLTELNNRDPFPSSENLHRLEKNEQAMALCLTRLEDVLRGDPFPPEAREPADFSAQVQRSIERIRANALAAGVVFSDALEASFSPYASGGVIPDSAHVPRLSRQLYSVERVVDVLVACGVDTVDGLSRDVFEGASGPGTNPPSTQRRNRRSRLKIEPDLPLTENRLIASFVEENGLYRTERVDVTFTAKEPVVWAVLDALVSADHFIGIVRFSSQTQTDIMAYDPTSARLSASQELRRFASEKRATRSRVERLMAGHELVRVSLSVDVYNFASIEKGERSL